MNVILYIIIFIIGTILGSFCGLVAYRVPRNIKIFERHTYCPKCNHELNFVEKIPILSYIFLGGKCKYCKQKISSKYLIMEAVTGIILVLLAQAFDISIDSCSLNSFIIFVFAVLYFMAIIIISAIDKEYRTIDKKVLLFGVIISLIFMIYQYIINSTSVYSYITYISIYIILLVVDTFLLRRYAIDSYIINVLMFIYIILSFSQVVVTILTIIMAFLAIMIYLVMQVITQKRSIKKKISLKDIPLGFYIGVCNIITLFMTNLFLQLAK